MKKLVTILRDQNGAYALFHSKYDPAQIDDDAVTKLATNIVNKAYKIGSFADAAQHFAKWLEPQPGVYRRKNIGWFIIIDFTGRTTDPLAGACQFPATWQREIAMDWIEEV